MIKEVLVSYSKENKTLISTYLLVVITGIIASFVLIPKFTSDLMNSVSAKNKNDFNVNTNHVTNVVLTFILVVFTDLGRRWLEDTIVPAFVRHVRRHIYEYVMNSHQSDKPVEIGKLLSCFSYLPYTIRAVVIEVIRHYLPHFLALIILTAYFFYLDTNIGALQLTTFVIFLLILYINSKECLDTSYEAQKDYMKLSENVKDKVSNISSIYATHQEDSEVEKYDKLNIINANIHKFSLRQVWKLRFYEEILIITSFIFFNIIVVKTKMPKHKAIALYVAELYYFIRIIQATQANLVGIFTNIGETIAMTEYMDVIISNVHQPPTSPKPIQKEAPAIKVDKLYFKYNSKSPWIFKDLNFVFQKGDKVYIKGDSGCGKTTLFKLILGSLQPNKGNIHIFGSSDTETIRDNISLVDQHSKLFNDTIYNNIRYSNNASVKDVKNTLKSLNTNIFDKLPNGIHTQVGVDSSFMSGGQRQLIILLRTYFRKAKVVLMDEPIASVDENNVSLILKMINMISKDRTLLVISHNTRISEITNKELQLC
ncbi:MAG: hypothetical protein CML47_01315 [Rhodobacteraceae bacterium]|nr:MAG: hypothetical protein CML47_01315 [Paracoccaceae bacterium]|tara:strand:- start:5133 stop:6749 length:1617 start_codon:yes stop_codon:yes gene_type:complete